MIKHWTLSTKIIVAFSALITLTAGILCTEHYWQLRRSLRQGMTDRLREIVQLAAPQIDSDYHSLVTSAKDANSVYYQINQKRLINIQAASEDILRLYTVRQQSPGQYVYILDYQSEPPSPQPQLGNPLNNPPPLLAMPHPIQRCIVEPHINNNSTGIPVLYGYAPIKGQFNRIEALLVVELDARPILQRESEAQLIAGITFGGILLVMLGIVRYLAQSLVVQPTLQLNQAAQRLAAGEWDEALPIERQDELGELARSFNHMAQQLQQSFAALEHYSLTLEQKVEERTHDLKAAEQAAQQASQAKSEFLANMSHELRTPLNGILGYAQVLSRSSTMTPKEQHGVNIIHQCGAHLLGLINDVLDLAKIEARKLELVPTTIHLPSLLQSVVEMCKIKAEQKGLAFIDQSSEALPTAIVADDKRLRQVLINLLGNAIKFTDQGTVTLQIDVLEQPRSRASGDDSPHPTITLHFQIIDTGVGIATADLPHLFGAFQQVGESQRQVEGTGLGLAISQRIVELMGSHIHVQSQLGVGSTFSFTVAFAPVTEWTQQVLDHQHQRVQGYEGPRRHLQIVDDRWENRAVIQELLEPLGFVITEAENGQQALEQMQQTPFDLIITDVMMPMLDGLSMLQQLRQEKELQHLKVIVSSASVSAMDQKMSFDVGADDFLPKPVNADDLLRLLAKHLQLVWIYEEAERITTVATPQSESDANFIAPSMATLQELFELAQDGLLLKLAERAEAIGVECDRYQPFAQHLVTLAKQFQIDEIEALLQQHLSSEPRPTAPTY